ncbi:MAG: tetratricopeptide repeat protein [Gammaproteobacteria bacterium]|nr:tetratricopeptide repeat protein [Gammaproteobacteria bacterium]
MKPIHTLFGLLIALLLPGAGVADSSGGGGMSGPSMPAVQRSPEALAQDYYKQGVKHKKRAWRQEERALEEDSEKGRDKRLARAQREYKKAISEYNRALGLNPRLYLAMNELGYALRKTGDYPTAVRAYNSALRLKPDFSQAIEYRGEAFLALGLLEETKDAYMSLFRLEREQADKLMAAMQAWIQEQRAADADTEVLSEFEQWVAERNELAGQNQSLSMNNARHW